MTVIMLVDTCIMLLSLQLSGDEIVVKNLVPTVINSQDTIIGSLVCTADPLPPSIIEDSSMRNIAAHYMLSRSQTKKSTCKYNKVQTFHIIIL